MRYATAYPGYQQVEQTDGDTRWLGIDQTRDRSMLAQGTLAVGQNTRLRTGRIAPRKGTIMPTDFNPPFAHRIIGTGTYHGPNGDDIMLIATAEPGDSSATFVYAVQYGKDTYVVDYSAEEIADTYTNGTGRVEFVQAFDKVLLIRSPTQTGGDEVMNHLVWDGTGDTNNDGHADTKFEKIALSGTGNTLVPSTFDGESVDDRIIFYNSNYPAKIGRDYWIMSDTVDYTSYDPVYQIGRTNSGESDYITRIKEYFRTSFIVYKNHSIYQVDIIPTYPFQTASRILSSRVGSVGRRMPLSVGGDEIFLSEPGGFYRLSEVIQNQIVALPIAISEPIQPTIDQINWPVQKLHGCSASIDNYGFFGLALGIDATRCNTLLVYNTQSRMWESVGDTWNDPQFGFNALHVTNYNGEQRLFAVDYDNSRVFLLYEGFADQLNSGVWQPINMVAETRGYFGNDPFGFKRFLRTQIGIATVYPRLNITAIMDGVNEEKVLTPTPITKDRHKSYTFGVPPTPPTADTTLPIPYMEDYAISGSSPANENVAIEDFELLPEGFIQQLPETSLITFPPQFVVNKQQSTERRLIRDTGRWVSLRFQNDRGLCEITGISIEGTPSGNTIRGIA